MFEKRGFMGYISVPFSVLKKYKVESFFWILCVIVGGQFGIWCNWILQVFFTENTLKSAINIDFVNGNFYIFSITLMASSFFIILVSILYDREVHFKSIKLLTLVLLGIGILWCGMIHALLQSKPLIIHAEWWLKYFLQVVGYGTGIFCSIYAACIVKLNFDDETHKPLDDKTFHKDTDKSVQDMADKMNDTNDDGSGVSI